MVTLNIGLFALLGSLAAISPTPAQAPQPTRAVLVKAASQQSTPQEARVALVIGNGAYTVAPLKNPVNDARAMTASLERCGFAVAELENATRDQMVKALRKFGNDLQGGGVGLFYFAGHGLQVKGHNYLMPVGGEFAGEEEVAYGALDADAVLAKLEMAGNRLNLMILDACRNNPFTTGSRSVSAGLAQMDAPAGSYIAFATAPGRTAADGTGSNGLYTQHLLANLETPGLKVEDIFKRVRNGVMADTHNSQVPWESSSLRSDFFFVPGSGTSIPAPAPPPVTGPYLSGTAAERALAQGTFETPTEAASRLAELPPLRVGTARLQQASYDQASQRLPVDLQIESWAAAQVSRKNGVLYLDRAQARAFCDEGSEMPLVARFGAVSGKLRLTDLSVLATAGSAPVQDYPKGRLLFYRPYHVLMGRRVIYEVRIGGHLVGTLHVGECLTVLLPPGPVKAMILRNDLGDRKNYPLDLAVAPDQVVYVEVNPDIEIVPPNTGEAASRALKNLGEKELD